MFLPQVFENLLKRSIRFFDVCGKSRLQNTSRRQTKSFSVQQFFKNAAEAWASSPHLRSK